MRANVHIAMVAVMTFPFVIETANVARHTKLTYLVGVKMSDSTSHTKRDVEESSFELRLVVLES